MTAIPAKSNRFSQGTSRVPDLIFRAGTRVFAFAIVGLLLLLAIQLAANGSQVFQTFDTAKYEGEKFECTPCHDDDPARKYKMPNPKLSAIPPLGSEDWKAMENARIVKFMAHRVSPVMAQLLGKPSFDPATGQGFSCTGCHPKQ